MKRYDPETGTRLTDCCGAYASFDEYGECYCKTCFNPVGFGEGDGTEKRPEGEESTPCEF